MSTPIEDYGLIGDCETAALVGRNRSLDWLCWPRFDSDACFAALLGTPEHGRWLLAPEGPVVSSSRRYRGDSLILETDIETASGAVIMIDFMPLRGQASDIVRMVIGRRGRVAVHTELLIRFGYGDSIPWVTRLKEGGIRAVSGPDMLVLRTFVPLQGRNRTTVGRFEISAGERVSFVLTYCASHMPRPKPVDPELALKETDTFWTCWSRRCTYGGPWREAVLRFLVVLKALTYRPTGGIVAAPTTSLPEQPGGVRVWDYRHCWLRDATITLLALMNAGYYEEADAWRVWLLRAAAGNPEQLQIMYGIAGERRLTEWEVPWLPGYGGAKPVRIGNAASAQVQLDVYGEVMDALHQARRRGFGRSKGGWALQRALVQHLEKIWDQPDQGIWESRGGPRHYTYSKVMAWVAVDRMVKSARLFGMEGPVAHWESLRDRIHHDVCRRGFDPDVGSFVQYYGAKHLDASLLMLLLVGFLPASDPRIRGTVAAVEKHLMSDGFVRRYDPSASSDGLPGGEGSFWLAENYVLAGRIDEGKVLFELLLELRSDLGLLAEEYLPGCARQVGNFPRAFSHVALVNTAGRLSAVIRARQQPAPGSAEDRQNRCS